jgi:hypothetical protein
MKSKFDTGNWSEVNGLPGQQDIMTFMEYLTKSNPNRCFTRRQLMDEVAKEFNIPATAQEAEGPKSNTPGYYTRLTYLISDAIQGVRRAEGNPFLKRIYFATYQHVTGNGEVDAEALKRIQSRSTVKLPKREVESCRVSVRILKNLATPHDPETIMVELGHLWSDEVIEAALKLEFSLGEIQPTNA